MSIPPTTFRPLASAIHSFVRHGESGSYLGALVGLDLLKMALSLSRHISCASCISRREYVLIYELVHPFMFSLFPYFAVYARTRTQKEYDEYVLVAAY